MCYITRSLRFTSGVTPADLLAASMAAKSSLPHTCKALVGFKTGSYHATAHSVRPGRRSTDWAILVRLWISILFSTPHQHPNSISWLLETIELGIYRLKIRPVNVSSFDIKIANKWMWYHVLVNEYLRMPSSWRPTARLPIERGSQENKFEQVHIVGGPHMVGRDPKCLLGIVTRGLPYHMDLFKIVHLVPRPHPINRKTDRHEWKHYLPENYGR